MSEGLTSLGMIYDTKSHGPVGIAILMPEGERLEEVKEEQYKPDTYHCFKGVKEEER
jgi:hypothetical protein